MLPDHLQVHFHICCKCTRTDVIPSPLSGVKIFHDSKKAAVRNPRGTHLGIALHRLASQTSGSEQTRGFQISQMKMSKPATCLWNKTIWEAREELLPNPDPIGGVEAVKERRGLAEWGTVVTSPRGDAWVLAPGRRRARYLCPNSNTWEHLHFLLWPDDMALPLKWDNCCVEHNAFQPNLGRAVCLNDLCGIQKGKRKSFLRS